MNLEGRQAALEGRHGALDTELHDEMARPMPDDVRITDIKRRKLALKDKIAALLGGKAS